MDGVRGAMTPPVKVVLSATFIFHVQQFVPFCDQSMNQSSIDSYRTVVSRNLPRRYASWCPWWLCAPPVKIFCVRLCRASTLYSAVDGSRLWFQCLVGDIGNKEITLKKVIPPRLITQIQLSVHVSGLKLAENVCAFTRFEKFWSCCDLLMFYREISSGSFSWWF